MNYGVSHSVLKPLAEVESADPRMAYLVVRRREEQRKFDLSDMHKRLSPIAIHTGVPSDVRRQFETAKNLMLYTWFVFEFQTCSEQQAYGALELALKCRFPETKRVVTRRDGSTREVPLTLARLLQKAVAEKVFVPERLNAWKRAAANHAAQQPPDAEATAETFSGGAWLADLVKALPDFRNRIAHGGPKLDLFASLWVLELCAELINALFPNPSAETP